MSVLQSSPTGGSTVDDEESSSKAPFSPTLSSMWKPVPLEKRYSLDPITKFRTYGRFPCKLLLHFIICVLFLCLVILSVKAKNQRLDNATDALANTFLPPNFAASGDFLYEYIFYNTSEIIDHVAFVTQRYYLLEFYSPGIFRIPPLESGPPLPVIMNLKTRMKGQFSPTTDKDSKPVRQWNNTEYVLTLAKPAGPFSDPQYTIPTWPPDPTQLRTMRYEGLWNKVQEIQLDFSLVSVMYPAPDEPPLDLYWNISCTYDFSQHVGRVPMTIEFNYKMVSDAKTDASHAFRTQWVVLHSLLAFFSFWGLALQVKALWAFKRFKEKTKLSEASPLLPTYGGEGRKFRSGGGLLPVLSQARSVNDDVPASYGTNPQSDDDSGSQTSDTSTSSYLGYSRAVEKEQALKMLGYNNSLSFGWTAVTIIAYTGTLATSLEDVIRSTQQEISGETFSRLMIQLGVTTWLNFVCMCSHYTKSKRLNVILVTIQQGLPVLINFLFGIFPVFIGYALAGIVLFGSYAACFASLDVSLITLFAVMNGDRMWDSFQQIFQTSNLSLQILSRAFFYTFVCLFIYSCLNITLVIIQDAYMCVKEAAQEHDDKHYEEKHGIHPSDRERVNFSTTLTGHHPRARKTSKDARPPGPVPEIVLDQKTD